jgi:hypothetical protein
LKVPWRTTTGKEKRGARSAWEDEFRTRGTLGAFVGRERAERWGSRGEVTDCADGSDGADGADGAERVELQEGGDVEEALTVSKLLALGCYICSEGLRLWAAYILLS